MRRKRYSRNRTRGLLLLTFVLGATGVLGATAASLAEEPKPAKLEGIEVSYETQAAELVLVISTSGGMKGVKETLRIYGNGEVIARSHRGGRQLDEVRSELDEGAILDLVQIAVEHGLAEWDDTEIQARLLEQQSGGSRNLSPSDRPTLTVLLSLQQYSRGDKELGQVEKRIRLRAPRWAVEVYPRILEFRGLALLLKRQRLFFSMEGGQP